MKYPEQDILFSCFYIYVLLVDSLLMLSVNILIDKSFLPHEAAKKIPLINSGQNIGMVTGGIMVGLLSHFILPTESIILIWPALMIISIVLVLIKQSVSKNLPIYKTPHQKLNTSIRKTPLIQEKSFKLLAITIFFVGITAVISEYIFAYIADITFPNENDLTSFFGFFEATIFTLIIFSNLFITQPIIKWKGLNIGYIFYGIILFIGSLLCIIYPYLLPACLLNGGYLIARSTIYSSSNNLFCSLLKKQEKANIRNDIDGLVFPAGIFVGACILILSQNHVSISQIAVFGLVASLFIILFATKIKKQLCHYFYSILNINNNKQSIMTIESIHAISEIRCTDGGIILLDKLKNEHDVNLKENLILALASYQNALTISALIAEFKTKSDKIQISIIKTLCQFDDYRATHALLSFFRTANFASFDVRIFLIHSLAKTIDKQFCPFLIDDLNSSDERLKSNAVEAIGLLKDPKIIEIIIPFLTDSNNRTRANAIIVLHQFRESKKIALEELDFMFNDKQQSIMISAIYVIGELQLKQYIERLKPLLKSNNINLKLVTVLSLAKIKHDSCIQPIIEVMLSEDKKIIENIINSFHRIPERFRYILLNKLAEKADRNNLIIIKNTMENSKHFFEFEIEIINEKL